MSLQSLTCGLIVESIIRERTPDDTGDALRTPLRSAESVYRYLDSNGFTRKPKEHFIALHLDGKHRLMGLDIVSIGTATSSLVHPREVYGPALRLGACAIIIAHNHPSGDAEPSPEDVEVTKRIHEAGKLLGVPMLDHVVIGDGQWVSLRERVELS